jgi:mRNA-degrading endonuclease toxin of MazEF toxin-antitoxin module
MQPERGDVVRSADPFKLGDDRQRPWLIVNNDAHPFDGEQYIAVAISTKEYGDSIPLSEGVWEVGGVPRQSFVSPWAVHSPRHEDFVAWQGRVTGSFVDTVVEAVETYLE